MNFCLYYLIHNSFVYDLPICLLTQVELAWMAHPHNSSHNSLKMASSDRNMDDTRQTHIDQPFLSPHRDNDINKKIVHTWKWAIKKYLVKYIYMNYQWAMTIRFQIVYEHKHTSIQVLFQKLFIRIVTGGSSWK